MNDRDDTPGNDAGPHGAKPDPKGLDLHRRLLERDPMAAAQLMESYYFRLVEFGARQIHDQAMRHDIAGDLTLSVVSKLIDEPERFDPDRGKGLYGFLVMDLRGDLLNYFSKAGRAPRITSLDAPTGSDDDDVGIQDLGGNLASDDPGPEALALSGESSERVAEIRREVVTTPAEGIVFDLQYVEGERSSDVFARALRIADLPSREQAAQVQKLKDRLAKRLRRMERNTDDRGRE
jgi:DNA-directed RNA polymerase specialized sigma24 family protein